MRVCFIFCASLINGLSGGGGAIVRLPTRPIVRPGDWWCLPCVLAATVAVKGAGEEECDGVSCGPERRDYSNGSRARQIIPAQTLQCLLPELAAPGGSERSWMEEEEEELLLPPHPSPRSLFALELLEETSVSSERRQDSSCPWNICGPVPRLTRWGRDLFVSGCLSRLAPSAAARERERERQALRASGGGRRKKRKG